MQRRQRGGDTKPIECGQCTHLLGEPTPTCAGKGCTSRAVALAGWMVSCRLLDIDGRCNEFCRWPMPAMRGKRRPHAARGSEELWLHASCCHPMRITLCGSSPEKISKAYALNRPPICLNPPWRVWLSLQRGLKPCGVPSSPSTGTTQWLLNKARFVDKTFLARSAESTLYSRFRLPVGSQKGPTLSPR
jgi:hypothetical protein